MVDRARLKAVEKRIAEIDDDHFIMDHWARPIGGYGRVETEADGTPALCKTALCIGGLAVIMYGTDDQKLRLAKEKEGVFSDAAGILGLTSGQADKLFYQYNWKIKRTSASRRENAVRNIRKMRSWLPNKVNRRYPSLLDEVLLQFQRSLFYSVFPRPQR
jgi:hypothetical protein